MKKLPFLITTALIGLSSNLFSQTNTTSYSENNDSKLGTSNLFLGYQSGNINSSGGYNVYSGFRAGYNSTGSWNTFTGASAGQDNLGSHNVFNGNGAGFGWSNITEEKSGSRNTFSGYRSGFEISSGNDNVFMGYASGFHNSQGSGNIFTGYQSGYNNVTGSSNVFTGYQSGYSNETGSSNIFTGHQTGYSNETGQNNVFTGTSAGYFNTDGSYNVYIGTGAGIQNKTGSNNVFLGKFAGFNETTSNKLYIDNSATSTPLIYGDFAEDQLTFNGKVSTGIGNTSFPTTIDGVNISDYTLFVQGGLLSEEVRVRTDWADYVFNDTYELKSLNEVESFINDNGHLPNVPSAKEVEASGIEMGEITKIQQEKIEELTLYLIAMDKRVKLIEQENIKLQKELVELNK